MNSQDMTSRLAQELIRDRIQLGRQSRLAALARCCHPSTWTKVARTTLTAAVSPLRRPTPKPAVCCD